MPALKDIEHLLFVIAEDVPVDAVADLPELVTTCRNYHLTPDGEDRAERVWPSFAVALRDASVTVHLRASMPDTLGEVTVIEAGPEAVHAVLTGLDDLPPATLVAVALGGGDAAPVVERWGDALGAPGTLLLRTPWTGRAWVSDEVCDHTSLIQLCERWTASRGRDARIWLSEWRRRVCGDLVGALDLGDPVTPTADGVPARPLPYAPSAEITVERGAVSLLLANAGGSRGVHLRIEGGSGAAALTVPESSTARPRVVTVPVAVGDDGRYDVTVTGPGEFTRHFSGGSDE